MSKGRLHTAGLNENDSTPTGEQVEDSWLQIARDAYTQSESYFDANIRESVERNYAHFANRHAPGSKYYRPSYKHRAKGFRPKTRSMVLKAEAGAAKAFFSTGDSMAVSAVQSNIEEQRVCAELNQELLQYRLDNTIPWFKTLIGAFQDAQVTGICISYQGWSYETIDDEVEAKDANGQPIYDGQTGGQAYDSKSTIVKDTSTVELRPIENVLFSISADWTDPVGTSPFIIDQIPMEIGEVKRMAVQDNNKSRIPWHAPSDNHLNQARNDDYDPIRSQREKHRQDSKDETYAHHDFNTVWVHRNIIREAGRDWVYYTLGIYFRLSDPIPLMEEYPHLEPGQRPYVIGSTSIEAHTNYPDSMTGLASGLQQEANEINNQRRDNVALVLNRRYFVKSGVNIDKQSLMRNVPGGITEMDDPKNDIKVEAPPDVTSSSYQEQDRVNGDMDELTGSFSQGSVASNRQLGETVGGLNLLNEESNIIPEYQLRIFAETWVEPVLKQLIRLQQENETDESLLKMIGDRVGISQRYDNVEQVTDEFLQGTMNLKVNVGFGATNPMQKVQKLRMGLDTILSIKPEMAADLDSTEFADEVLGSVGYKDAERFFPKKNDANNQNQMTQPPPVVPMSELEAAKLDLDRQKHQDLMAENEQERQLRAYEADLTNKNHMLKLSADEGISLRSIHRDMAKIQTDRQNTVDELKFKIATGRQGI